jgi:hypothetical protein
MATRVTEPIIVENAKLIFRNFTGREQPPYNGKGMRNFCIIIPENFVEGMRQDGWNIKETKVRDEGDEPEHYIKVNVRYDTGSPPRVALISSTNKKPTELKEGDIDILDTADIQKADIIISPYNHKMNDGGVSGYLKSAFITIRSTYLEDKYEEMFASVNQTPGGSTDDAQAETANA